MRVTAILVKWEGGWRWVSDDDAPLRIETQQDHSGDLSEILYKAGQELITYSSGQTELTVGINVADGDPTPGVGWSVGDEVYVDGEWQTVIALTSTLDDQTGLWTDVPQFGVRLDSPDERVVRNFQAVGGVNGGTSHLARPAQVAPGPNLRP